jgi:hypothetical protein
MQTLVEMMDHVLPDQVIHKLVSTTTHALYISLGWGFCHGCIFLHSLFISNT